METTPNSSETPQEAKSKRSPWLIIIIILLLFVIGCCIIGVVLCRGSQRLPRFLDRFISYAEESGVDVDEIWQLIEEGEYYPDGDGPSGGDDDGTGPDDATDFPELIEEDDTLTPEGPQQLDGCPLEPTEFILQVDHNWDFSPNREIEKMKIDGRTDPNSKCPLVIRGQEVIMNPCQVGITNSGFVNTDDGPCDINSTGYALIEADSASCQDGVVTINLIETIDDESEVSGEMVCPNMTQPYFPFFPYSNSVEDFNIAPGGNTQTEDANPDTSNQFRYNKSWTLRLAK